MNNLSRSAAFSSASMIAWLLDLATRLLARAVNMPEPLVQHTGFYVFAQVQAVENRVGKSLCPVRLLRQLQNCFHRPTPLANSLIEHDLRANAFRVCREGKPLATFPDHALARAEQHGGNHADQGQRNSGHQHRHQAVACSPRAVA